MHYNKEAQMMNSASINYTQGYLYPNTYKTGDSGGSRGAYGCGGSRDPTTLLPIPYSTGSIRTPNTWVNLNYKNSGPSHSQPSAMLTSSTSQGNGQAGTTWIPDYGASFHLIGDSQNMKQFTHFDGLDQIFIGNGEGLCISNTGSASFISPNDVGITFKLHKLLHVPSILKKLLSVSQFVKDNSVFFEFHLHACLVKSQETNNILLKDLLVSMDFTPFIISSFKRVLHC